MPALPACLLEPLRDQSAAFFPVLEESAVGHLLGCHRRRIPDHTVFEHVVLALVQRSGYERIPTPGCPDRIVRRRLEERSRQGVSGALRALALDAHSRTPGLDLGGLSVDGCTPRPRPAWLQGARTDRRQARAAWSFGPGSAGEQWSGGGPDRMPWTRSGGGPKSAHRGDGGRSVPWAGGGEGGVADEFRLDAGEGLAAGVVLEEERQRVGALAVVGVGVGADDAAPAAVAGALRQPQGQGGVRGGAAAGGQMRQEVVDAPDRC